LDQEPLFNQKDISDVNGPVDTKIDGAAKTRMLVANEIEAIQAPGASSFTKKYRSDFDEPSPALVLTASFQEIFSYTGTGKFIGFVATFSNTNPQIKLTIDSEINFNMKASEINDAQFANPTVAGPTSQMSSGGPIWDATGRRIGFMSTFSIEFKVDVKIEALKVGAPPVNYIRSIVNLTKET